MARDGNGDYTAPSNTVNPATTGTTIDPNDFNEFVDDLETALSASNFTAATSGTDNSVMRADGTGGRKVQTSAMIVDDSGNASGIANLTITGNLSGATLTDLAIALGSDAQGDIYYRDASGNLARLGPGTAGQTLVSGGAGANPSWSAAGSGDVSAASTFGTDNVLVRSDGTSKGVQSTGITVADTTNDVSGVGSITPVAGSAIRTATSDTNTLLLQAYDVDGAAYTTFGTLTAGNTPTFNLSSSVTIGGVAIASISGSQTLTNKTIDSANNSITLNLSEITFTGTKAGFDAACSDDNFIFDSEIGSVVQGYNASLAAIAAITFNQGEILYHNGTSLVALGVGTSGQVLQSGGVGANPSWTTVSGTGDVTAASTIADNAIVRGDGGAKGIQQSALSIDDSGNLSGVVNFSQTGYHDIVEIAEPSSPSANTARIYAVDDGSGTTNLYWKDSAGANNLIGKRAGGIDTSIYGLRLSNNTTDATNDIDIASGGTVEISTGKEMKLSSTIVKRLDAAWAVGTNQGGLDTGTIANGTYHVWLIKRSDTGVVDALFSTSATSPTMPTNYDIKRRIGSILRESAAIVAFKQRGDFFTRATAPTDRSSTAAATDVLVTLSIPTGIEMRPMIVLSMACSSAVNAAIELGHGFDSTAEYQVMQVFADKASNKNVLTDVFTNTSAQIRFCQTIFSGSLSSSTVNTFGWIDRRSD